MATGFQERRHDGAEAGEPPPQAEGIDRRQFPPPSDLATITPEAELLQSAIDSYKIERRLKRITVVELLRLLGDLGYRRN